MVTHDLTDELALITGCTGGIGRATAKALASLGCGIAVHYNSAKEDANQLVAELQRLHVRAASFQADVSNYDEVRRLHERVSTQMGDPTILFANAGTPGKATMVKSIDEVSIEDFESTWRTNCGSAFLLTQLCIPAMEKRGWGRIIFCSSVAGFTGGLMGPHYASSKSALHGLVHWLSGHYAPKGITVNGVAPAVISGTKMLPDEAKDVARTVPVRRLGECDEVAETVLWMVKTGYVTNKVIGVDGGLFIQ